MNQCDSKTFAANIVEQLDDDDATKLMCIFF